LKIDYFDIKPNAEGILASQGIPLNTDVKGQIKDDLKKALKILEQKAKPEGLIEKISKKEFSRVFAGIGKNDNETPLQNIYPKADNLALYSITIGHEISKIIEDLFKKNDFLIGTLLDSAASIAAENAVEVFEKLFQKRIGNSPNNFVLSYSPGYCGWHISSQGKLFEYLHPEQIGISLNDSYLMTPLKSVTGVLVDAAKELHKFKTDFPFCSACKHHSCVERMKRLYKNV
jgi:hypothetical protein